MRKLSVLAILSVLAGCAVTSDAGCIRYAANRPDMPRPLPADALGRWVAITDADMTGACR